MNTIIRHLDANPGVHGYKINLERTESYELFFVKGALETVRNTDNTDKEVTVYVDHGENRGHASFHVYPSTTEAELDKLIGEAIEKAVLIDNPHYALPAGETGDYTIESNFSDWDAAEVCAKIANTVFSANTLEVTSLNAVEVFLNRITETVVNSNGLHKQQHLYRAMVEAIPTATDHGESVELYEQYNFNALDEKALYEEIAAKLTQAKDRHEARRVEVTGVESVILNAQELKELFWNFADDLDYNTVYSHHNVFKKGDVLQTAPEGDRLGITLCAAFPGSPASRAFDRDGMTLGEMRIIDGGKAVAYHGSNRFGQYLGEAPTGMLPVLKLDTGTAQEADLTAAPYLEIVSMSGIQTDFYSDYVGGEIRLAYWHDGESVRSVTGVSVSGKLSEVLNHIRFSSDCCLMGSYYGPRKAIIEGFNIF